MVTVTSTIGAIYYVGKLLENHTSTSETFQYRDGHHSKFVAKIKNKIIHRPVIFTDLLNYSLIY